MSRIKADILFLFQMLADLAVQFGVQAFIYSSAMRFGPKYEDELKLSNRAKSNIELHCMGLGEKGLPWMYVNCEVLDFVS